LVLELHACDHRRVRLRDGSHVRIYKLFFILSAKQSSKHIVRVACATMAKYLLPVAGSSFGTQWLVSEALLPYGSSVHTSHEIRIV